MQDDNSLKDSSDSADTAEEGLAKSGLIVSCMTMLSRVLGLARDLIIAGIFGDGPEADAFLAAFRIPNFLRRLFAEGAFSQAFVPVLSQYRKTKSFVEVKLFVDHVAGRLGLILLLITIVGVLGAQVFAGIFAPGYLFNNPEKFSLLADMLRITFPYILLISLTGFAGAILNSYGRFAVPAMTPIILNISLISCAIWLSPLLQEPVQALAWGVLLAGVAQLLFQLPFLAQLKLLPQPRVKPKHEGVTQVLALMLPVLFSVGVGQINLLLDTFLATFIEGDGSLSWLYFSDRLMELPLGIFGIAIATVILPSLSRIHADESKNKFRATLDWGLRIIMLIGIPASIALIVLAEPLVITLYQRGAFSASSVLPTAASLRAYGLGLVAFMSIKVLASGYFSRQDTATPVRYGVISMASNMGLNLLFFFPLAHVGLALATSLGAFINAGLLLGGLIKQKVFHFESHWWRFSFRLILANGAMILFIIAFSNESSQWLAWDDMERIIHLAIVCGGGITSYALVLLALGIRPVDFKH